MTFVSMVEKICLQELFSSVQFSDILTKVLVLS